MSHHRKDQKVLKTDIPAVAAFAAELDKVIKARTSENKLFLAAGVGHSKLVRYLDGRDVPHPRVLQHYILDPLDRWAPLTQEEFVRLMQLHWDACTVQEPKKPTEADQIAFLEDDLERARSLRVRLQERLNAAFAKNIADREHADQLTQIVADLRGQVEQLNTEQQQLTCELGSVKQAFDEATHQNRRELAAYRQQITQLQEAVTSQLAALRHMQETIDYHDGQMHHMNSKVRYLEGYVTELEARNAEDRRLFMKLVAHQQNSPVLETIRQERDELRLRHERGEETISQLTATVARLTEELERVTLERDFLSSTVTTVPLELPTPVTAAAVELPTPTPAAVARVAEAASLSDVGKEIADIIEDDAYWAVITFDKPRYP